MTTTASPNVPFERTFDFDAASAAWRRNKRPVGQGQFVYVCEATTAKGTPCKLTPLRGVCYCHVHQRKRRRTWG